MYRMIKQNVYLVFAIGVMSSEWNDTIFFVYLIWSDDDM